MSSKPPTDNGFPLVDFNFRPEENEAWHTTIFGTLSSYENKDIKQMVESKYEIELKKGSIEAPQVQSKVFGFMDGNM